MRIDLPCPRSPGELVLCAVSGGRDSMVLLHLLHTRSEEWGLRLAAAHFNHCLRPTADRDEQFVRDWCGARGIPLE
ncbi:MAG: tRNA(Ile)-lysidine synthetase, partial [Oscillospiraceae bacterium]|nr:tRNA(Ile)-lysidine synthetase [Oscillospiraceae bacterium]